VMLPRDGVANAECPGTFIPLEAPEILCS